MHIDQTRRNIFAALREGNLESLARLLKGCPVSCLDLFVPILTRAILQESRDLYDSSTDALMDIRCCVAECKAADTVMGLVQCINQIAPTLDQDKQAIFSGAGRANVVSILKEMGNPFDSSSVQPELKFRAVFDTIQLFVASNFENVSLVEMEALQDEYYTNEVAYVLCLGLYYLPSEYVCVSSVCRTLLHCEQGPIIMQIILLNSPNCYNKIVKCLIEDIDCNEDATANQRRVETIYKVVDVLPHMRDQILSLLICQRSLPSLCIGLLCQNEDDADFVHCLLKSLALDVADRSCDACWLPMYIHNLAKKAGSSVDVHVLECRLLKCVEAVLLHVHEGTLDDAQLVTAKAILTLISALNTITAFKLCDSLVSGLLSLLTCRVSPNLNAVDFIRTSLATILVCPTLMNAPGGGSSLEAEKLVIDWVQWLLADKHINEMGDADELLLLIAIHFHSAQLNSVIGLASTILGFKVNISVKLLSRLRTLFTLDLLPEHIVAQRSADVSVTVGLSEASVGLLPVHCVLHLLRHRAFIKHSVSIQEWIVGQLWVCDLPVASVVVELVEAYTKSCLALTSRHTTHNPPIDEQKLKTFFMDDDLFAEDKLAPRVLVLFYLLAYEDIFQAEAKKFVDWGLPKPMEYSEALWQMVPVKFLIRTVIDMPLKFTAISSSLMKLVACHCAYLIGDLHLAPTIHMFAGDTQASGIAVKDLENAFVNVVSTPGVVVQLLSRLSHVPLRHQIHVLDAFVNGIQHILQANSYAAALAYKQVWIQLEAVFPRRIYSKTVSALSGKPVSHKDMVDDPLCIFRVDRRVFRAEREELMRALVGAQESAAVQMMLEICLPIKGECLDGLSELTEIRSVICSQLHQMFIADPMLCKVVHFQGYDVSLLRVVVQGVPSMHICIDFIPQLLCQDDIEKRVLCVQTFGFELLSLLCVAYPIVKALCCAQQALNTCTAFLATQSPNAAIAFMQHLVPSLERICLAFPVLRKECEGIFVSVCAVCKSKVAVKHNGPTLITSTMSQHQGMDRMEMQLLRQVQQALANLPTGN